MKKKRFFSSFSKNNETFLPNRYNPSVDLSLLNYDYSYFNFQNCIERSNLILIFDRNLYVNVSVWYQNVNVLVKFLNSEEFNSILHFHTLKYGENQQWYYFKNSLLLVHPTLLFFFIPKENKKLREEFFYYTYYKSSNYYEQIYNIIKRNTKNKCNFTNSYFFIESNAVFQVPVFEFEIIKYAKLTLQNYSWSTLDFYYCFFSFRGQLTKTEKSRMYFGTIKDTSIKLSEKIVLLRKHFYQVHLVSIVKFYENGPVLSDFEQLIISRVKKKRWDFIEHSELNLKSLDMSTKDFYVFYYANGYWLNSYFCSYCSEENIDLLNQNMGKLFKI